MLPHLNAAHNLARWLVRDPALAEDVVQDGMVRALAYFPSFRGGDGRAWLMRIVRNVAYTMLSARQPSTGAADIAELDLPDPADNPEIALTRRQAVDSMQAALAALPLDLRECIVLRELEELSYKDIAQIVGVPVGTVMSRLWRARQMLMNASVEGQGL
nr:sigma-70 family RNA polymerase sigma factor [Acidisphaera sp. L21]